MVELTTPFMYVNYIYAYILPELYSIMTMAAEWEKNRKEEDSVNVEVLFRNLH
jgi:hypothetical protein